MSNQLVSDPFRALAHSSRRRILEVLAGGECGVSRICDEFAISRPAVAKHLRILERAGLVAATWHGREHRYRIAVGGLAGVVDWLRRMERTRAPELGSTVIMNEPLPSPGEQAGSQRPRRPRPQRVDPGSPGAQRPPAGANWQVW